MNLRWFAIASAVTLAGIMIAAGAFAAGTRSIRSNASATSVAGATATVPGATWETVTPAEAGLDAGVLDEIAAQAQAGRSNCLVVVRDGKLAGEWYFNGAGETTTQNIYSVSKSIASTLVGIAQDAGFLTIEQSASTWITGWKGTPSEAVTVRNVLSNDSGREWSRSIDYVQLLRAPDRTAFAISLSQGDPPGTVWAYNNSAIQTLQPILQNATGQDVVTFARERLFDPLGMTHTAMTTDRAGHAQMFEGVRSTCRDLARFGLLMLNHGQWDDTRVVSSEWVAAATGRPSTELVANYGYLWWLNHEGILASPAAATNLQDAGSDARKGRIVPGAPDDMYWALGFGNQIVQIDPASNTVVVRLGTPGQPDEPTFGPDAAARVVTDAITRR
jgi:CubicO group peptidase (beta-lactamase class C family)